MKRVLVRSWISATLAAVVAMLASPPRAAAQDTSMCSTSNTSPIASCFDWVTGPASTDNATVQKKYFDPVSGWVDRTLFTTDMGCPVTNPAGTTLEMMIYGDTAVRNPASQPEFDCVQFCKDATESQMCGTGGYGEHDPLCHLAFHLDPDGYKPRCECLCAPYRSLPAFASWTNTVFYSAQVDVMKTHHIGLGANLNNKHVVVSTWEEDASSCPAISMTGVYGTDYFYVCPGSANSCADSTKKLQVIANTVSWYSDKTQLADWHCAKRTLLTDGSGIYQFGTLANKNDATHGCRLAFAQNPPNTGRLWAPFCSTWPDRPVQPPSTHALPKGGTPPTITGTGNHGVLWSFGSRFQVAVVLRDFADVHDPSAFPQNGSGTHYVYILGGGERSSAWVGLPERWAPTGNIFLARVPASETAVKAGSFQYYTGLPGGVSQWGSYANAVPVYNLAGFGPTRIASTIEKNGTYYLAVSASSDLASNQFFGMIVASSTDGISWTDPQGVDYVVYSDVTDLEGSALNVYGHYRVPSVVFNDLTRIPYLFSVWKNYRGFSDDFFYGPDPTKYPISDDDRFRDYNTKMYWYDPQ